MSETVREKIIAAIIVKLADVTIENGYNTDCGESVLRVKKPTEKELPAFAIWPGVEENVKRHGKNVTTMPIKIEGIALRGRINPSIVSELILGDIRYIMEAQADASDPTGGWAESIEYAAGGTDEYPDPGEQRVGAYAIYNITYKTMAGTPYPSSSSSMSSESSESSESSASSESSQSIP